jgi:hypothetical protein
VLDATKSAERLKPRPSRAVRVKTDQTD